MVSCKLSLKLSYLNNLFSRLSYFSVTMLPIDEVSREEDSTLMDSLESVGTDLTGMYTETAPLGGDIQEAIEKGDWAAVGATAAILATKDSGPVASAQDNMDLQSSQNSMMSDDDDMRAAEIDQLVETGNWDGVVAVAARYADEADEADEQLERPLRHGADGMSIADSMVSKKSGGSDESVSIASPGDYGEDETSAYSNTTRDSVSHTTANYSSDDSHGASTNSPSTPTPPGGSLESSITTSQTSSFVSRGITDSMVSAASSVDQQEKRQMTAFRAEVEALVRRVVPDEIDNVDDIMVQFSGREEELIQTLRAMQEKSIAQRARAAVQRSAKREAGKTGRRTDGSMTTDGSGSTTTGSHSYATSGDGDSITEQFTEADDYSTGSSMSGYSSRSSVSGSEAPYTSSSKRKSLDMISEGDGSASGTSDGRHVDASDWGAVQKNARPDIGSSGTRSSAVSTQSPSLGNRSRGSYSRSSKESGSMDSSSSSMDELINSGDWSGIIDKATEMRGTADDLD